MSWRAGVKALVIGGVAVLAIGHVVTGGSTSAPAGAAAVPPSISAGKRISPAVVTRDVRKLPQVAPVKHGVNREPELPWPNANKWPLPGAVEPQIGAPVKAAPMPNPFTSIKGLDFQNWGAGHPPDTNGDVGPTYFVQVVNTSVGIFDKSSGSRVAAFTFNTLWQSANSGTPCDNENYGDPTVVYDSVGDRWIVADFAFADLTTPPFYECIAVSRTGDPVTGGWYLYPIRTDDVNHPWFADYPKMGIWPDGLYMTANMFDETLSFREPRAWAFNRSDLEAGLAVRNWVADVNSFNYASLLPSNMRTIVGAPPAGRDNLLIGQSETAFAFNVFKFHVDWGANTASLTGPTNVSQSSYSLAPAAIPTPGDDLDSLGDRLMMQAQYTNLGGKESVWVNHTIRCCGSNTPAGIQWAQIDVTGGTVATTPVQQQRYPSSNDGLNRWMGSLAVDKNGDMALGYSVANPTTNPDIRYAGRLVTDPLGTLPQTETTMLSGLSRGSQVGISRWGDYSAMTIDPNGCTFWYTQEYYATTGLDWQTRIGSFKFPSCSTGGPPDFVLSADPGGVGTRQGGSATSTITTAVSEGTAQTVDLSATGQPAGVTVDFSPSSVTAGSTSTMTVTVDAGAAPGTYPITVTGTGTTATHTTEVALTVASESLVNGGFESGDLGGWTTSGVFTPLISGTGHTGGSSAQLGSADAFEGDSTLTQAVAIPAGASQVAFWYQPHCTDDVEFDQIQAEIRSLSGDTLASVLNVCDMTTTAWTHVVFQTSAYAGKIVVLWFNDHDDGYPGDPTYFLLDDIAVTPIITPPKITSFSPSSGPVGKTVTIKGSGFLGSTVTIGGVSVPSPQIDSASQITAAVPSGALTGKIVVSNGGGTSISSSTFRVTPVITSFAPATAQVGQTVDVYGSNLNDSGAHLKLGSTVVPVLPDGATPSTHESFTVTTAMSTGKLQISTPSGSFTTATNLGVVPTITGFSPSTALAGQTVTLTGFTLKSPSKVTFGSAAATASIKSSTPTTLVVTVPATAVKGSITVTNSGGGTASANTFTPVPKLGSFSPSSGTGGSSVTINGSGLAEATGVSFFNGVPAVITTQLGNKLVATVPATAITGPITVAHPNGPLATTTSFKPLPKLLSTNPSQPVAGNGDVTLTGVNMTGGSLKLSGKPLTIVAGGDGVTEIHFSLPLTAATGTLTVQTPNGTSAGLRLQVLPVVSGFTPDHGVAGDVVTISGNTLSGPSSVTFGTASAKGSIKSWSSTQIKVGVPSNAIVGKITVTTAGGSVSTATDFTPNPRISSFSPGSGPVGKLVKIKGSGLAGTTDVKFNGTSATEITQVSATEVDAKVPVGTPLGANPIQVTAAGVTAVSTSKFTVTS